MVNSDLDKHYKLCGGLHITSGANLNDYNTPGNYLCYLNVDASTLLNCPTKNAFTLKVEFATGEGYPCQTLREYNTGRIYYRMCEADNSTWSPWRNDVQNADISLHSLTEMQFFKDGDTVGFRWLFGTNKEYGYALNINVSNGGMQFYYLQDGHWVPSWTK